MQGQIQYFHDGLNNWGQSKIIQIIKNFTLTRIICGNLQETFLSYDAVSNITQQSHSGTQAPESREYEYDAVNRLITELTTDGSRGFEYDAVGNRLLKTATDGEQTLQTDGYSYGTDSNRLQAVDAESYQYDANGNLLSRGNQSWTYNARNRMATYSENGTQQASYTYNAQGERVKKTLADGTVVHFQYNGMGQLMAEYRYQNGSQVEARQYVWLGMMPVAVVVADGDSNKSVYYLHSDHLATARLATDQNQNVVWQWESSAFGEELPQENGLTLNLRFPGQYYDAESGLNYNYFRDYDAGLGRYIQSDPIGVRGGVNTYGYVYQSPVNILDPTGEYAWCFAGPVGWVICGGTVVASLVGIHEGVEHVKDGLESAEEAREDQDRAYYCLMNPTKCESGEAKRCNDNAAKNRRNAISSATQAAQALSTSVPGTSASGPVPTNSADVVGAGVMNVIVNGASND